MITGGATKTTLSQIVAHGLGIPAGLVPVGAGRRGWCPCDRWQHPRCSAMVELFFRSKPETIAETMETLRCVDAVNAPNRKPQVTNCTEIDRVRSKAQLVGLTRTRSRGSSPLSSTTKNPFRRASERVLSFAERVLARMVCAPLRRRPSSVTRAHHYRLGISAPAACAM